MEHISTSFFRSSVAGSFKEHRMVFQTSTPETRFNNVDEVNTEKSRIEALIKENPDPATSAGASARTELRTMRARAFLDGYTDTGVRDAARAAVDTLQKLSDSATESRTEVATETTRLKDQRSEIINAINAPGGRDNGINLAVQKLKEATDKLKVLGDNASPEAAKINRLDMTTLLREHVKAIQDMAATGKLKIEGTTEVSVTAPPLTEAQKNKLTKPYSALTAAEVGANTNGAKETLGRGFLRAKGATEAGNVYTLKATVAGAEVTVAEYTWDAAGSKWTVKFLNAIPPALGPAADVSAAAPIPAIAGAPPEVAAILVTQNDILDKMKNGVAIAAPDAAKLEAVITDANAGEVAEARRDSERLDKAQTDFMEVDFSQAVRKVEVARDAAGTPEGKTRAIRDEMDRNAPAPKGLRVQCNERRNAIWTELKTLSERKARPSNYADLVQKLETQLRQVTTELRNKEVSFGLRTAPATPPAAETRVDRPARTLNTRVEGRNITITVEPADAQVSIKKPDGTTEVRAATGGTIRIENAAPGRYEFTSGGNRAEVTIEGAPATPATPEVTTFLGSDAERTTLKNALSANVGNLDVPAVRDAIAVFQKRLSAVPVAQRNDAVNRLIAATRTPATATADGAEVAAVADGDSFRLEARRINRTPATPPSAPERKERNERLSEFIKVIIELIRALIQVEQARNASIDRFLTRSLENQQKFMADMQAQMKAFPPAGRRTPAQDEQFRRLEARYKEAQGQIKTLEARVKELESRHESAVKAAGRTRTLEVRWTDEDRRCARPPVVCVRPGAITSVGPAVVANDIAMVRREVPLVATTVPGAAVPTREVPTTTFYVGTMVNNYGPNAQTTVIGSSANNVVPPPRVVPAGTPPPPPRIAGSGPAREGSLNG